MCVIDRFRNHKTAQSLLLIVLMTVVLVPVSTLDLEQTPPLWWDEGWTLNVAKNWVLNGWYGQTLDGEQKPPGLSAAFPVVAQVALSFRLFGVGVWQGRLPGVILIWASIFLSWSLANRLYNSRIAWIMLVLLLIMPMNDKLHPILIGRQVLGEAPMLFYLLMGYALLLLAMDKHPLLIIAATVLWGTALRTKAQVLPFWLVSMLLPMILAAYKRWWWQFYVLLGAIFGAWLTANALDSLQSWILSGKTAPQVALEGYYGMSALVPALHIRLWALLSALSFGIAVIAGLIYAAWRVLKNIRQEPSDKSTEIVRMALWGLAASWLGWYLLLSMYWPRYLFPALFIGNLFAAALIHDLTQSFNLAYTVQHTSSLLAKGAFNRQSFGALLAVLLIAWTCGVSGLILVISHPALSSSAAQETTVYLQHLVPNQALIESYETPLFFLLDRRWHFPPDQVHVQLNRRTLLDAGTLIDYDPLASNPDYLVVGPSAGEWRLYDSVLDGGEFIMLREHPPYTIYQRVR